MPTSQTPQLALLCCRTLSSALLRRHLLNSDWSKPQDQRELREQLYLSSQPWQARLPDHVFDLGFKATQELELKDGQLATTALQMLAERYLEVQHGQMHAKLPLYGEWQQSILSRVSGMPIMAAMQALHFQRGGCMAADLATQKIHAYIQLPSLLCVTPRDGAVEDYISREGLHESHLHLNGSSFAEQCWLRAMARPEQEVKQFSGLWQTTQRNAASDRVRELARLHDADFSPTQFRHDLMLARQLRGWLVHFAQQPSSNPPALPWRAADLRGRYAAAPPPELPKEFNPLHSTLNDALAAELTWMTQLLRQHALPSLVDRMLHLYLLLQHQYRALMVQGEELYGFDQFQKFTHTELRSRAEKRYLQR
ncbi:MAG TPA: hypothetical protein VGE17_04275, partial [Methylophilus sp.]